MPAFSFSRRPRWHAALLNVCEFVPRTEGRVAAAFVAKYTLGKYRLEWFAASRSYLIAANVCDCVLCG
jgi:hypothetical protein